MLRYYLNVPTYGIPFEKHYTPSRRVVNLGTVIELQDNILREQLVLNEHNRNGEVIDWHLFRSGTSILIDNRGEIYACIHKCDYYVELAKLVLTAEEKEAFLKRHNIS